MSEISFGETMANAGRTKVGEREREKQDLQSIEFV